MDWLNVHRSAAKRLRESRPRWFEAELLPAFAPDLTPVEVACCCTKPIELANYAADDLFDLGEASGDSLCGQHRSLRVRRSYFKTAQLPID